MRLFAVLFIILTALNLGLTIVGGATLEHVGLASVLLTASAAFAGYAFAKH